MKVSIAIIEDDIKVLRARVEQNEVTIRGLELTVATLLEKLLEKEDKPRSTISSDVACRNAACPVLRAVGPHLKGPSCKGEKE